jgi:signal transduction histidine kinase
MTRTGPDDLRNVDPPSSLRSLGEALASTASLPHLARLITRQLHQATRAARVALIARDEGGRLLPTAAAPTEDGHAPDGEVVALPLVVHADVEGIVVVQGGDRAVLDPFVAQAAWAVAAVRAAHGGRSDAAATRARITGQVLHEVNNRLGAIQIYAYLLAERMRRGEDAGGVEVAGKLCSAVDRLGGSLAGLAGADGAPAAARSDADLDALVSGCLAGVADDLARHGVRVLHQPGEGGSVLVHEPTLVEGLQRVLKTLGALDGASERLAVTTGHLSPHAAEIVIDSAVGARRVSDALFAGEADELGRALVRDVIEAQAGTVSVRRTAEDGALIRVELGGGAG